MSFLKIFDFPIPDNEDFNTAKLIAESVPEHLDGRELWILRNFIEGDFE